MVTWDDHAKCFCPIEENLLLDDVPVCTFTGTIVTDLGHIFFDNGAVIGFDGLTERMLPYIIIELSKGKTSGESWRVF